MGAVALVARGERIVAFDANGNAHISEEQSVKFGNSAAAASVVKATQDTHVLCAVWARLGECSDHEEMHSACARSCAKVDAGDIELHKWSLLQSASVRTADAEETVYEVPLYRDLCSILLRRDGSDYLFRRAAGAELRVPETGGTAISFVFAGCTHQGHKPVVEPLIVYSGRKAVEKSGQFGNVDLAKFLEQRKGELPANGEPIQFLPQKNGEYLPKSPPPIGSLDSMRSLSLWHAGGFVVLSSVVAASVGFLMGRSGAPSAKERKRERRGASASRDQSRGRSKQRDGR